MKLRKQPVKIAGALQEVRTTQRKELHAHTTTVSAEDKLAIVVVEPLGAMYVIVAPGKEEQGKRRIFRNFEKFAALQGGNKLEYLAGRAAGYCNFTKSKRHFLGVLQL